MPATPSVEKLFGSAKRAVRNQNWPSAYDAYATVLKRFPANVRAKRALQDLKPKALPAILTSAQKFQGAGEWVQAERHLRIAADLAPEITEVQLALAACQLELGRAPAALRTADRILQRHPQNRQALIYKGRAAREMGLNSAAERASSPPCKPGNPTRTPSTTLASRHGRAATRPQRSSITNRPSPSTQTMWNCTRTLRRQNPTPLMIPIWRRCALWQRALSPRANLLPPFTLRFSRRSTMQANPMMPFAFSKAQTAWPRNRRPTTFRQMPSPTRSVNPSSKRRCWRSPPMPSRPGLSL